MERRFIALNCDLLHPRRRGDGATWRWGDEETGRQGDGMTGRGRWDV